jgi:beta-galactosidase/beta-glucuronidase
MAPTRGLLLAGLMCALALVEGARAESNNQLQQAYGSDLITKWGQALDPQAVWSEYPRPQLERARWTCLNGPWDYAVTQREVTETPTTWAGKLLVPFCLEAKLGGVQRLLQADEALWYHRTFPAKVADGKRLRLNFEAVDYACQVFVNGQQVGEHRGGHTPFSFDVTAALQPGDNNLVVRVEDATEEYQLRGKQVRKPEGIWYTRVSGIWQTVWLEEVPRDYLHDLKISTTAATGEIRVRPILGGDQPSGKLQVVVKEGEREVASQTGELNGLTLRVPNAKLWSPDLPHLYALKVTRLDENGKAIDQVTSYAGIRTVGKARDAAGHWRFTLNGQPIFHWGPLDQGWWPEGLLTPPSDAAMAADIEFLKAAGFNMIRKHIKVEPRRYYYHADRLGMMLWQDQVSGGPGPEWTRMGENPLDAEWPDDHHQQYLVELERMIDTLENHPSIVVWVPFNEAWGQHRSIEVGKWTSERDPSRLVNIASGGNFWPVGDVADHHEYPDPSFPLDAARFNDFVKVVGEFGGHGLPVRGHLWKTDEKNWGYGGLPKNKAEYEARYVTSLQKLQALREQGIAAGVYTQTTDVEGEINGLMTYDRAVQKLSAQRLAELRAKFLPHDVAEPKVSAREARQLPQQ